MKKSNIIQTLNNEMMNQALADWSKGDYRMLIGAVCTFNADPFLVEYDAILQLEKTSHIRGFYLYKLATGQIPGKDIVKNTGIIKGLRFQDFH